MKKRPDLIIDLEDFPVFLKARMLQDSVEEYAAKLGVSSKLLYALLRGSRKPSPAILKKLGLKVAYRVVGPQQNR